MGRVNLVVGRAGSGKSGYIQSALADEIARSPIGSRLYWVVPDEASYVTERKLLERIPTSIRAEVVHLQRLAERANRQLGARPGAPVNTSGKRLLLADVYQAVRHRLDVLRQEFPAISYLDAILDVFDEMYAQQVAPERIQTALEAAATRLADLGDTVDALTGQSLIGKLRDLCLLFMHWKQALDTAGRFHAADVMGLLAPHLGSWPDLQGAKLFLDGFSDLSALELQFVLDLAEAAEETTLCLTMDPAWLEECEGLTLAPPFDLRKLEVMPAFGRLLAAQALPHAVFAPQTLLLYQRIVAGARARGLEVQTVPLQRGEHARTQRALVHLEQCLYGDVPSGEFPADGAIRVVAAQNPRVEAEGIAREILNLHRAEGIPLSEIAVLIPSLDEYGAHLRAAFAKYEIPVSIDDYPSLASHPLPRFLLAALQAVEESYTGVSMCRLLKSDFCGLTRDEADWLEEYVRRYEVSGAVAWFADGPWRFAWDTRDSDHDGDRLAADDAHADRLRRRIADYLSPFADSLAGDQVTPRGLAAALWKLMEQVRAKRIVADWMVAETAEKSPLEASLHEQAWQKLMNLLGDLDSTLPERLLPRSFLIQVIRSDLLQQSLTSIPAGLNEVVVSEYRRAREFSARVVFVAGATDDALPRKWNNSGLLQDEERTQFFRLFGQPLGYTTDERQWAERATVYSVFTRAVERLYVTHPLSTTDGKEARPSLFVSRIRTLFGSSAVERLWTEATDGTDGIRRLTARSGLEALVAALRGENPLHLTPHDQLRLLRWLAQTDARRALLAAALPGLAHRAEARPLHPATALKLYDEPLRVSVHQLEAFGKCPYQHFLKYGLRLQEEAAPEIRAADRGTLVHDVLHAFVERLAQDMENWRRLDDAAAVTTMRNVFAEVLERPKAGLWRKRAVRMEVAEAALRVLEHAAVVLTRHARYGTFAPAAMELAFGPGGPPHRKQFTIRLADDLTVVLRGRIDRVDTVDVDGDLVFRIIDYKSSQLDIDLAEVEYGLSLQLPIYAAVVEALSDELFGRTARAVGLLYIPLVRQAVARQAPAVVREAVEESLRRMRSGGLIKHDRTCVAAMDRRLVEAGGTELFKPVYKKDGDLHKHAPVLEPDQWDALLERALQHLHDFARAIRGGDIRVAPYWWTPDDYACRQCGLQSVCHLDLRFAGQAVRRLRALSREDVLALWEQRREECSRG